MTSVRYSQIKSIADVKTERVRVEKDLEIARQNLNDDYERIDGMLSVEYVISAVSEKLTKVYSLIQWLFTGYDFVRGMIDKYRTKDQSETE